MGTTFVFYLQVSLQFNHCNDVLVQYRKLEDRRFVAQQIVYDTEALSSYVCVPGGYIRRNCQVIEPLVVPCLRDFFQVICFKSFQC